MAVFQSSINVSGLQIAVRDNRAAGHPIVMLHGSSNSSAVFARQFESPLTDSHRLVAIDLPGHGASDDARDPSRDYSIVAVADLIAETLTALDIRDPTVFGWSLGGHVAMQMAAAHRNVCGLLLSGTPPLARGPLGLFRGFRKHWDVFLATKAVFSRHDAERFARLCFEDSFDPSFVDAIMRADGHLRVHFFRSLLRGDGIDQKQFVETTDIPIAILNGERDPFVRLGYVEQIAYANLWRGRCHLVPATGHAPFWYAAELFNPVLAAFAKDVGSGEVRDRPPRAARVA